MTACYLAGGAHIEGKLNKPVRTERSGSLRVAVNGPAGRKSKRATCRFTGKRVLVRLVGTESLNQAFKTNINGSL